MKRLVLLLGLVLLLALVACNGAQTDTQVLPGEGTPSEVTVPVATMLPEATAAGDAGAPLGQIFPALPGTTWQWVDLSTTSGETIAAADPARYAITFNADGTANITADCNSVMATYTADEMGNLQIIPGATTLVACPEDSQDQLFLNALVIATNYFGIDTGNDLYIVQAGDAGTLRFQPAAATGGETGAGQPPAGGLTGVTWEWASLNDAMGQTAAADPTRYTIIFNDDGSANITADCNTVTAQYVTDGQTLSIIPGASSAVLCEPDSQDQLFLNSLSSAAGYTVEDGELFVEMEAGAGTIIFRQQGSAAGEQEEPSGTSPMPTLVGGWEWVSATTAAGEATTVDDPTQYAITFAADGTAGVVADCNVGNATYTTGEGNTVEIVLGISTMAFCEDSLDQAFRAALEAATTYAFQPDGTLLLTAADGATATFRAATASEGATGETAEPSLTGAVWQWAETTTPTETVTAADPTRYTITFNEDGTAAIQADCNQVVAAYTVADSALTITPGASTLAMCPPDSQAGPFITGLSSAAVFFFQDGDLYIDQFASAGTMRFTAEGAKGEGEGVTTPPAAGGLVGTTWQLTLITKTDGNITINDPSRFTITFNDDGTANLVADCNVGSATYTLAEGNMLTITPGVSTMAFCGVGSFDQIFLGGLTNAMGYRLEEGNLIIDMLYESGSLVFMPAQ